MDQNGQRRSARLAGSRSQAQAYVTNQRDRNQHVLSPSTISRAHVISQRQLTQPMPSPPTISRARVETQQELTQPMLLPLANSRAQSAFSNFPAGPSQQHPHVSQSILQPEPKPEPEPESPVGLQRELFNFWARQYQEVEDTTNFRNHALPLARIKRIMKNDDDVSMISADACVVFSKACEIFIKELTTRSWVHVEENSRRTLHRGDIANAIAQTEVFDFLVDVVPKDDTTEHDMYAGIYRAGGSSGSVRIAPNCQDMPPPPPRNGMDEPFRHRRLFTGTGSTTQAPAGNENLVIRPMEDPAWPPQQQQNDDAPPGSDEN